MGQRFGETLGECPDAAAGHGFEVGGIKVAQVGLARIDPAGDAVQAGGEVSGHAEIGIDTHSRSTDPRHDRLRERGSSASGYCHHRR